MAKISLTINGQRKEVDVDPDMPLLWTIRDYIGLTGTKFGCGIAQCGACTVHLNGESVRSCVIPTGAVKDKKITTIEGLSKNNDHPVQLAWIQEQVPQCGYCQSGQIMSVAAMLEKNSNPSEEEINNVMNSVLCRCGCYPRIKKAINQAINK
jgi:aerobic-type carbon monoxide dehydrogenase small subunit (CoxS/CutS family)